MRVLLRGIVVVVYDGGDGCGDGVSCGVCVEKFFECEDVGFYWGGV